MNKNEKLLKKYNEAHQKEINQNTYNYVHHRIREELDRFEVMIDIVKGHIHKLEKKFKNIKSNNKSARKKKK